MSRFSGRSLSFDIAATLLVVLAVVSVVDIDDYGMHRRAMITDCGRPAPPGAPQAFAAVPDPGPDSDHACACLLCTMTIPDTPRPRVLPPSAGKLPAPVSAGIADSPHPMEVFRPPSA